MKYKLITLSILAMPMTNRILAQELDFSKVKTFEHQLEDVMEIIDTNYLKIKLQEVEAQFQQNQSEINKARLGIIYHETALNLGFLANTTFKGYAEKSYSVLKELCQNPETSAELLPIVTAFEASALSLLAGETVKLSLVGDAFQLFEKSIEKYSKISSYPEFLRGSVAENLPWFFLLKKKYAKKDMQSIIDKQLQNSEFATSKIMSFVYWAWANQYQKRNKEQSLVYLYKAIALDPDYKGGRQKAEELKSKMMQSR